MGASDLKNEHKKLIASISSGSDFVTINTTEIDGNLLRKILLGLPITKEEGGTGELVGMPANGLKLSNVTIRNGIDLSEMVGRDPGGFPPLLFENCTIQGFGFVGRHSFFTKLRFSDCTIENRLDVTNSSFQKSLEVIGLKSEIPIHAADISIAGSLIISDTTLRITPENKDISYVHSPTYYQYYALDMTGATVSGSIYLRPQFKAIGGVNMEGAEVHGNFWADGAYMEGYRDGDENGYAFFGRSLRVKGALNLCFNRDLKVNNDFVTEGKLSLFGARLGFLFMRGCLLKPQSDNDLFNCYCLQIENSVIFSEQKKKVEAKIFETKIKLDFNSAEIKGRFNAKGAKFTEFSGHNMRLGTEMNFEYVTAERISISGSEIKSNLFLNFVDAEVLSAKGIAVGGRMSLGGSFSIIRLKESTIYGSLSIHDIRSYTNPVSRAKDKIATSINVIDLRGARVMHTLDDKDGFVFKGDFILKLNGFKYERFGPGSERHPKLDERYQDRLKWLLGQFEHGRPTKENYDPQPFHQVVKVFKNQGQYNNSLKLLKERLKIESQILYNDNLRKKTFQWIWWRFFDFGLSRFKSFAVLCIIWLIGIIVSYIALEKGCFVQTGTDIVCSNAIQPIWYSFDVLLPLLDVGQESRCEILYSAGWLRSFFVVYKIVGWIVVSIFILSLTGFVKRQQE